MTSILIVLNHLPTQEQLNELHLDWAFTSHHYIRHPNVYPKSSMSEVRQLVSDLIASCGIRPDAIWHQGDYRMFAAFIEWCRDHDVPLLVATSKREVKEITLHDGSIQKTSIFKHVKFIRIV